MSKTTRLPQPVSAGTATLSRALAVVPGSRSVRDVADRRACGIVRLLSVGLLAGAVRAGGRGGRRIDRQQAHRAEQRRPE